MACIIWQLPNGERYLVAENKAHHPSPGAFNTGVIDWTCDGNTERDEIDAMIEHNGIQWGSAIKWVTQRIGIKQCSACKAREAILNHVKEHGWAETIRQLKDTF